MVKGQPVPCVKTEDAHCGWAWGTLYSGGEVRRTSRAARGLGGLEPCAAALCTGDGCWCGLWGRLAAGGEVLSAGWRRRGCVALTLPRPRRPG